MKKALKSEFATATIRAHPNHHRGVRWLRSLIVYRDSFAWPSLGLPWLAIPVLPAKNFSNMQPKFTIFFTLGCLGNLNGDLRSAWPHAIDHSQLKGGINGWEFFSPIWLCLPVLNLLGSCDDFRKPLKLNCGGNRLHGGWVILSNVQSDSHAVAHWVHRIVSQVFWFFTTLRLWYIGWA